LALKVIIFAFKQEEAFLRYLKVAIAFDVQEKQQQYNAS